MQLFRTLSRRTIATLAGLTAGAMFFLFVAAGTLTMVAARTGETAVLIVGLSLLTVSLFGLVRALFTAERSARAADWESFERDFWAYVGVSPAR